MVDPVLGEALPARRREEAAKQQEVDLADEVDGDRVDDELLGALGHYQEEAARDPHRQLEQHIRHGHQRNEPAAAAADLAADVAAHHAVILAARERHEAVHALAMLSAKAEEATDKTCAQLELEEKIAGLQEKYKGAADAVGPGGLTPLILVCIQGEADDVAALLTLGADPAIEGDVSTISVPDRKYKCTPLMLTARDGHVVIVRVLLAHERVSARGRDGGRPPGGVCFH